MKAWIEYPDSTKFARGSMDILYTPIFFANQGVSGDFCVDLGTSGSLHEYTGEITLKGVAGVGYMSMGGQPANFKDGMYGLPSIGFRPLYNLSIMDFSQSLSLSSHKVPFHFPLPTSALDDVQRLSSSLKVITSDTSITGFADRSPTMVASVRYALEASIYKGAELKTKSEQEVRIFVSLNEDQLPPPVTNLPQLTNYKQSQVIPLEGRRRLSIIGRRKASQVGSFVIVEAGTPEPLAFQPHSDAAAAKIRVILTYNGDPRQNDGPPSVVTANVDWMLMSITTMMTLEGPSGEQPSIEAFHLKTKILPVRKLKLRWADWSRLDDEESTSASQWQAVQDIWLTHPLQTGLTPSFRTSYMSHTYDLRLTLSLSGAGISSSLGAGQKVELYVPINVRYELGLAPSYTIDQTLPEYSVEEEPDGGRRHFSDIPPPGAPPDAATDRPQVTRTASTAGISPLEVLSALNLPPPIAESEEGMDDGPESRAPPYIS